MRLSLCRFAVISAAFFSNICQAAPMSRNLDSTSLSTQQIDNRAPYAPKTKLFITHAEVTGETDEGNSSPDDNETSVFEIRDTSGAENEIKRIVLPKGLMNKMAGDSSESSSNGSGNEAVQGRVVTCGVDKMGRNYCRTSDGWYEYRCETGEVAYFRQIPFADEEVCSDGSIA